MLLATYTGWDNGGGNQLWSTAANWTPDGNPAAGDAIQFNSVSPSSTILVDGNYTFQQLEIANKQATTVNDTITATWQESGSGRSVTVGGSVTIGLQGLNNASSNPGEYLQGTLLADGVDLTIGSPASRATMLLGKKTYGTNHSTRGILEVRNAQFTAYLSSLQLGDRTISAGSGYGLLDLDDSNTTSLLDVSGDVNLGYSTDIGNGAYTRGTIQMANGTANIGGNVRLARYANSGSANGTQGYLYLSNTPLTVAAGKQVIFGGRNPNDPGMQTWDPAYAKTYVTVAGRPSGLDVQTDANGLLISSVAADDLVGTYNLINVQRLVLGLALEGEP